MQAVVIERPQAVQVVERETPQAGPEEVVIRVRACGICGTDVHILHGGFRADYPVIPGHEFTGTVIQADAAVSHLHEGDPVVVDPNISCGVCPYCRRGHIHLCRNLVALGVNLPGGFAEFCRMPAKQAYPLPANLSLEEAALTEPLACCLHGVDRAAIQAADTVVLIGAGPIGLLMLQLVRLAGASRIIVSEPTPARAAMARQLGADLVLDPTSTDVRQAVLDRTEIGADVVIECVGHPRTAAQALTLARRGGNIVLFGVAPKDAEIAVRPYDVFLNELTLTGSYINPYTHARAIDLLATGKVQVQALISHRFPLAEFPQAIALAERGGTMKILVTM